MSISESLPDKQAPSVREMTPAELARAVYDYNWDVNYYNTKPSTRRPRVISLGVRRVAFASGGVVVLDMRPGWQLWQIKSRSKLSPLTVADVVSAVRVMA